MPLIPMSWLSQYVPLGGRDAHAVSQDLVKIGLEEEAIHTSGVTGPVVVGQVLDMVPEPQKNGKTINWCQVDVGEHNVDGSPRGIVCGAHNFGIGDKVVVSLPGAVLPGDFTIAARKTYGHVSDGMICSARELGLGEDHAGIIVLSTLGLDPEVGSDAIGLLGLDDEVLEINVTPDRGYCFSMRGVAREFSHSTGAPFTDPAALELTGQPGSGFGVEVRDDSPIHGVVGCDRFVTRIVRGFDASVPSPDWMARRLAQSGMRPISLAVDVTNYVMLELGQPMHAYDLRQMEAPVVVRRALPGEKLTTLDDVERTLDPEDLLISDSPAGASRIQGIAGVMGGALSEVTPVTRDVLLEAAHFDAVTVARSARRHKLSSEAAKRFERGVDPALAPYAVQRAAELLAELGGGQIDETYVDLDDRPDPSIIDLDPSYPGRLVGLDYPSQRIKELLEEIGCEVEVGTGAWRVKPPSWRPDLTRAVDLVEEVARLDSYDNIRSIVPPAPAGEGYTFAQRLRRSLARALAERGMVEVLTYPFVSPKTFDELGYASQDERRRAVKLSNPLSDAAPLLRTSILQTLPEAVRRNVSRGFSDLAIFEIGAVTFASNKGVKMPRLGVERRPSEAELAQIDEALAPQPIHAAGLLTGNRVLPGVLGEGRRADWADAIEVVRISAVGAGVDLRAESAECAPFHPGRCAQLWAGSVPVGHAGELHPTVCRNLGLPARTVAFEVSLDKLIGAAPRVRPARGFSVQPVAKEDLAFVVDQTLPAINVVEAIKEGLGELCESAEVFDVYSGDQVGPEKKSVAVAVRLRGMNHTLDAEEIKVARNAAVEQVFKSCGGVLRS